MKKKEFQWVQIKKSFLSAKDFVTALFEIGIGKLKNKCKQY